MKILVVALGSPNADDQIAWLVVEEIEKTFQLSNITFFKSVGNGTDWYHEIKDHHQIIFIDAALTNNPIGDVLEITSANYEDLTRQLKPSSHCISLFESIKLAENLNLLTAPYRILAISIGETVMIEDFSNELEHQIPNIKHQIIEIISKDCDFEGIES